MTVLEQHKAISFALAILDRAGLLESDAAEKLREESDGCWKNLTEQERKQAQRFAGSLQ